MEKEEKKLSKLESLGFLASGIAQTPKMLARNIPVTLGTDGSASHNSQDLLETMKTAALLAKVGKRVLVLEQHYIAGGTTHSFEDKGFEFDTGLHYGTHRFFRHTFR